MKSVKTKLRRKGICPCGFSVVNDDIPIGQSYVVYPKTKKSGFLICGGCGKKHRVQLVKVSNYGLQLAYLPIEIFTKKFSPCKK